MSEKVSKQNGAQAWLVAIVVTLCGIYAAMSVMKINPCASLIMQFFDIGEGKEGLLLSVSSILGVIIAIPCGAIMNKFGARNVGIVCLVLTILGGVIGSITTSYAILLIARIIEGFAFATWAIVGPIFIKAWFTPARRGFPMGIFSVWVGWCMLFIFRLANLFLDHTDPSSWHNVWWFTVVVGIVCLVLFVLFGRLPKGIDLGADMGTAEADQAPANTSNALKSIPVWCIVIMFLIFSWAQQIMTGYTATYNMTLGADIATANILTSNWTLGNVIGALLMGLILNKVTKSTHRGYMMIVIAIASCITYATIFNHSLDVAAKFLLITGFLCIMFTPIGFNTMPDVCDNPRQLGLVLALASCSSMVGHVFVVFGGIAIEAGGYGAATALLLVLGAIYLITAIVFTVSARNREKKLAAGAQE